MQRPSNSLCEMPRQRFRADGGARRVGVEIELSGLSYRQLVQTLSEFFGQTPQSEGRYETRLSTSLGDFLVELDADPIKQLPLADADLPKPLADLGQLTGELIDAAAERIAPLEVVCPPIEMANLKHIESLCEELRRAGALGSRHALWYAFGLQLNPELPSLDAATILNYLRAFIGLYEWLKSRHQLDISRKFTTYIDPFPSAYCDRVMAADYAPNLDDLIDDFLRDNPTRNRALDLMPLFAHLRPARIQESVGDPRIKPRPTLHYRLPDSDLDNPDWHFHRIWNDWVQVDDLANDPPRLRAMCQSYRECHGFLSTLLKDWKEECQQWLPHVPA